jgi:hypothetical protein
VRVFVRRSLQRLCLLTWLAAATACSGTPTPELPGGPLSAALVVDPDTQQPVVRVTGWSSSELNSLRPPDFPDATWNQLLQVRVAGTAGIDIAARHRVNTDSVDVVPRFALDRGREYVVRINPSVLPAPRPGGIIETAVMLPAATAAPAVSVTAIYPSSSVWPDNILRFYLHFSAPMSGTAAVGHVRLVDDTGQEVRDALLELDVDLWNRDYTRRTVFFDPGRVKRGIRPNRELGRALVAGRKYAIVVSPSWRDGRGQELVGEFRHEFTAGPPVERPVEPAAWVVSPPPAGSRDPLVVRFPWALDEGLLQRALGVTAADGQPIDGTVTVRAQETEVTFTPAAAWRDAPHSLVVLTVLEDPAGNKVGQAFEFEMFAQPRTADAERTTIPFRPR